VVNLKTGVSVIVRCNDLGPGKKARKRGVIIDLTPKAWEMLGLETLDNKKIGVGIVNVGIQEVID
jgi:rare lipoprotein A (peptidoglycan hydrolase)